MEENKVKSIKEQKLKHKANENLEKISRYQDNPIKAKFLAFQQTKKDINLKDLF